MPSPYQAKQRIRHRQTHTNPQDADGPLLLAKSNETKYLKSKQSNYLSPLRPPRIIILGSNVYSMHPCTWTSASLGPGSESTPTLDGPRTWNYVEPEGEGTGPQAPSAPLSPGCLRACAWVAWGLGVLGLWGCLAPPTPSVLRNDRNGTTFQDDG
jgi:hypothetical protein